MALHHARPDLARVVALAFHTGQRGSDIVRMRFSDIEEQTDPITGSRHTGISIKRTQKVGLRLWIPCTAELLATVAGWERVPPFYMVLNPFSGEPYTREQLSVAWNTERRRNPLLAPLEEGGAVLHGLRASCVIRLRNRGATSLQIESMIGMSRPMVERYSRHADRNAMAIAAVHHLDFGTPREQIKPSDTKSKA
jgi:integrase